MGQTAVEIAESSGYLECRQLRLLNNQKHFFLEVNTRVTVEHSYNLNHIQIIYKKQILIVDGKPLSISPNDVNKTVMQWIQNLSGFDNNFYLQQNHHYDQDGVFK